MPKSPVVTKRRRVIRNRPEQAQQIALFQWAAMNERMYPALRWMFAVPNGEKRTIATGRILKAMGVKRGVLDVWLPIAGSLSLRGLVFEFKAPGTAHRASAWSTEQSEWRAVLILEGWAVCGIDDWTHASDLLLEHLR